MTDEQTSDKDVRWKTIASDLRAQILEGRYGPGSALPSEPELVRRYSVSRPTVRKAIETLVSEGLVYVMRGRGSFVRPAPDRRLIVISSQSRPDLASPAFHPEIQRFGWKLAMRDMGEPPFWGKKTTANGEIASMLLVRPGHPVIHRYSLWTFLFGGRVEINSYTDAELLPDWDDPKRFHQYRKRPRFFYDSLKRAHGITGWTTLTSARISYENERAQLDIDYAEALLIIRRTMLGGEHNRPMEVTEVKAPANRFELAYGAELADDQDALFRPEEPADGAVALLV